MKRRSGRRNILTQVKKSGGEGTEDGCEASLEDGRSWCVFLFSDGCCRREQLAGTEVQYVAKNAAFNSKPLQNKIHINVNKYSKITKKISLGQSGIYCYLLKTSTSVVLTIATVIMYKSFSTIQATFCLLVKDIEEFVLQDILNN